VQLEAYNNPTPSGLYQDNGQYQDMTNFLDDQLLAELGWMNSSSYLYPTLPGPLNTDWYSPTNVTGFAL
jgi:hypothetical protein